jgi:predicted O-methyltransferase YrrM
VQSIEEKIRRKFRTLDKDTLPFSARGTRHNLVELFAELGYKKGAEIGVYMGDFSIDLCQTVQNLELICVDPWEDFGPAGPSRRHMEERYQHCVKRLSQYQVTFMRMPSLEAVKQIPDESLDFVYIDALHDFNNAILDIIEWERKVKHGGIVAGHDYTIEYQVGVIEAVRAYTKANNVHKYYVTFQDDVSKAPSWFWVKG